MQYILHHCSCLIHAAYSATFCPSSCGNHPLLSYHIKELILSPSLPLLLSFTEELHNPLFQFLTYVHHIRDNYVVLVLWLLLTALNIWCPLPHIFMKISFWWGALLNCLYVCITCLFPFMYWSTSRLAHCMARVSSYRCEWVGCTQRTV